MWHAAAAGRSPDLHDSRRSVRPFRRLPLVAGARRRVAFHDEAVAAVANSGRRPRAANIGYRSITREMASRRPEGTALLVAGYGALGALEASALHTLGQIGEALLATGAAWQIRRLAATAGALYAPDRGTLKQHFDELSAEPARTAVVVLLGTIMDVG